MIDFKRTNCMQFSLARPCSWSSFLPGFLLPPCIANASRCWLGMEEKATFAVGCRLVFLSASQCNLTFLWPTFKCFCKQLCSRALPEILSNQNVWRWGWEASVLLTYFPSASEAIRVWELPQEYLSAIFLLSFFTECVFPVGRGRLLWTVAQIS